jgi:hypothetical protein
MGKDDDAIVRGAAQDGKICDLRGERVRQILRARVRHSAQMAAIPHAWIRHSSCYRIVIKRRW